jgi:hypothetical protein
LSWLGWVGMHGMERVCVMTVWIDSGAVIQLQHLHYTMHFRYRNICRSFTIGSMLRVVSECICLW